MDLVTEKKASVDRLWLQDPGQYRFASPLFRLTALAGVTRPFLHAPPTRWPTASDFMVKPLSRGQHTIYFKGVIPSFSFKTEATYHITVGP